MGALTPAEVVGANVRRGRLAMGWTQEELGALISEKCGAEQTWTRQTMSVAEKGARAWTAAEVAAAAEVLGVNAGALFGRTTAGLCHACGQPVKGAIDG